MAVDARQTPFFPVVYFNFIDIFTSSGKMNNKATQVLNQSTLEACH